MSLCRTDEVLLRNIWLPSPWDKLAQAELSAVVCGSQTSQAEIRLGLVPLQPWDGPSPLGAHGMPIRERCGGERGSGLFLTALTVRLAHVGLRNAAEYIPTRDRCMENPFFNFWQKGIGMQLGKLQTHAHPANFCNNRKLVTVNSGK